MAVTLERDDWMEPAGIYLTVRSDNRAPFVWCSAGRFFSALEMRMAPDPRTPALTMAKIAQEWEAQQ